LLLNLTLGLMPSGEYIVTAGVLESDMYAAQ